MRFRSVIVSVVAVICVMGVYSVQAAEKKWQDEAELSFVDTGGNTDTTSLSAKNKLVYQFSPKVVGTWKAATLYGETDGEKTAERYSTELRADYLFTDRFYAAGTAGWEKNKFEDLDARYYGGPTLGYKILTGPKHLLNVEGGVNYVFDKYADADDEDYAEGCLLGNYTYAFSEKSKFKQEMRSCIDLEETENYTIRSETALITSLTDKFSLKTGYEVKYDNQPASDDVEKTDTFLSVTLVVNF